MDGNKAMNKGLEAARAAPRNTVVHERTRKGAIDAMCKYCIYDEAAGNGTWRQQTQACTATTCPLYEWRPMSTGAKS
jgi:hypothetical protein